MTKLKINFILLPLVLFLFPLRCYPTDDVADICRQQLFSLSKKLTLSNYSLDERENNLQLCDSAYSIIKLLSADVENNLNLLPHYLHLSYKLANCFQQNNRSVDGEIVLQLALNILEKLFPGLNETSPEKACENLRQTNPSIPSLYAALCHYAAKSYIKRPCSSLTKQIDLSEAENSEKLLKRSLELRAIIDRNPHQYTEPLDSGRELFYSSHTLLFSRTLGYFYMKKGDFSSARALYENIFNASENFFEKIIASSQLITIYCQLARQEWDVIKANDYYFNAHAKTEILEEYLRHKNWSGSSTAFRILAEFYTDKSNPFYDPWKGKIFLEEPILKNHFISDDRLAMTRRKLGKLYEQLSQELLQKYSKIDSDQQISYSSGKTSSLLNIDSSMRIKNIINLVKIYRDQKLFLQSGLLLSNVLVASRQIPEELSQELWHQLYLTEYEYFKNVKSSFKPPHNELSYEMYVATIKRYRNSLNVARTEFKHNLTVQNCWIAHKKLSNDIQKIIECMFKETLSCLQPIRVPFAVIGLGSLSREIMSPYSDLEYLIVYDASASIENQEQIDTLSTFFLLRLIAIGETPSAQIQWDPLRTIDMNGLDTYSGMRPDSGGIIGHSFGKAYKMSGTIQELVTSSDQLALQMAFIKGRLLFGSEILLKSFYVEVEKKLLEFTQEQKNFLLWNDFATHGLPIIHINAKQQRYFSPKHAFLRGISLLLSHLALRYKIFEQNPSKILDALVEKEVISETENKQVKIFLQNILYFVSTHYQENCRQLMEVVIADEKQLESFLNMTNELYKSLKILSSALFSSTAISQSWDLRKLRLRTLCRGCYLDLVKEELAMENKNPQLEIAGDVEMLKGNFHLAYEHYQEALNEKSDDVHLNFKLSEASLFAKRTDLSEKHLKKMETLFEETKSNILFLKINYLKCLIARTPDPYTQVIIGLLQATCPVIFYTPSKSFAIQVPHLICDL